MKRTIVYAVLVAVAALSFIAGYSLNHKINGNRPIDKEELISAMKLKISQEVAQSAKIQTAMSKIQVTDALIKNSCQNASDDLKSLKKEQSNNIDKFTNLYKNSLFVDQPMTQAVNKLVETATTPLKSTQCQQVDLLLDPNNLSLNIYDIMFYKIVNSEKMLDNLTGQYRDDSELKFDVIDLELKSK